MWTWKNREEKRKKNQKNRLNITGKESSPESITKDLNDLYKAYCFINVSKKNPRLDLAISYFNHLFLW